MYHPEKKLQRRKLYVRLYPNIKIFIQKGSDRMPLITYRNKNPDRPTEGYTEWLADMLRTHSIGRAVAKELFSCSDWMLRTMKNDIDYIRIAKISDTRKYLLSIGEENVASLLDGRSGIFFNENQLYSWLLNMPTYVRQTKRIPLADAFHNDQKAISDYLWLKEDYKTCAKFKKEPWLAKRALELLIAHTSKFCPQYAEHLYTKRRALPFLSVSPFAWFNDTNGSFFSAAEAIRHHAFANAETMYRAMFLAGAIKISFGRQKTYFFVPDDPQADTMLVSADWTP